MSAGVNINEGTEIGNLRLAGAMAMSRSGRRKENDVWRFSTTNPDVLELVAVWGSVLPGDLIQPYPMILSTTDELIHPRMVYNNPALFKVKPEDLFVVVEVNPMATSFTFKLLPASGGNLKLSWYHLLRRRVTDVLLGNP